MLLQLVLIIDWQAPVHSFGCKETLIELQIHKRGPEIPSTMSSVRFCFYRSMSLDQHFIGQSLIHGKMGTCRSKFAFLCVIRTEAQ